MWTRQLPTFYANVLTYYKTNNVIISNIDTLYIQRCVRKNHEISNFKHR